MYKVYRIRSNVPEIVKNDKLANPTSFLKNIKILVDDFYLPPKSLLKAKVKKKNKNLGWETRYIVLGMNQLLISRDPEGVKLLNVIPLTPGSYVIKQKEEVLDIITAEREFGLKFETSDEGNIWQSYMTNGVGRDLTDFIGDTVKMKENLHVSPKMKKLLTIERDIKETLVKLNKLKEEKDKLENELADRYEYEEYVNSDLKLENYKDSIIKDSVKAITQVRNH